MNLSFLLLKAMNPYKRQTTEDRNIIFIDVRGTFARPQGAAKAATGDTVLLETEPDNTHDSNAIKILIIKPDPSGKLGKGAASQYAINLARNSSPGTPDVPRFLGRVWIPDSNTTSYHIGYVPREFTAIIPKMIQQVPELEFRISRISQLNNNGRTSLAIDFSPAYPPSADAPNGSPIPKTAFSDEIQRAIA